MIRDVLIVVFQLGFLFGNLALLAICIVSFVGSTRRLRELKKKEPTK